MSLKESFNLTSLRLNFSPYKMRIVKYHKMLRRLNVMDMCKVLLKPVST